MHFLVSSLLLLIVSPALSAPTARHVVHERRSQAPSGWLPQNRIKIGSMIPVRIGLSQSNLETGYDELMKISDPESNTYGQHWTPNAIAEYFAPAQETIDHVLEWIASANVRHQELKQSESLGWIEFKAPIEDIEELFKAEYHIYRHEQSKSQTIACLEYSVPEHIQSKIDFIMPTLHFDTIPGGSGWDMQTKRAELLVEKAKDPHHMFTNIIPGPKVPLDSSGASNFKPKPCAEQITPSCLRELYNIPPGEYNMSSFGVVEYAAQTYRQTDLNLFWANSELGQSSVPASTKPKFQGVDGGYTIPSKYKFFSYNGEADLDLEYAMDLVYPQEVTLFQVGDQGINYGDISFNNFLDALDKSYCTFRGGDSKLDDEQFPDPKGYQGKQQCGIYAATAVISTSYGYDEAFFTEFYARRQCYEYMKLGLAGTSFLYASGDYGVAGAYNTCLEEQTGVPFASFNPGFPSTCPFVTSVGATQLPKGSNTSDPETAASSFSGGGGFSNVFGMPSYQSAAQDFYFKHYKPSYNSSYYNNSMAVRGYPDVSANGAYYVIAVDGKYQTVFGTSASTPTFSAIIALINNKRAAIGKKALGFLNPIFYKHPEMFNDIKSGSNPGCGTGGFYAVRGWDPVTGLGTPNYTKMEEVLLAV